MTFIAEKKKSGQVMQKPHNKNTGLAKTTEGTMQLYVAQESVVMYSPTLPAERKDFILAHKCPRIHELPAIDVDLELNKMLELLYVEIGDKATSGEDKRMLMKMFLSEVKRKFSHISLADVKNALSMGVRGEFDRALYTKLNNRDGSSFIDKQDISLVMLLSWLQSYIKHLDRVNTVFEQTKFEEAEKLKLYEDAKRKAWLADWGQWVMRFCYNYKDALERGVNPFMNLNRSIACPWFEYFEKNGMLILSREQKASIWPRARKAALSYYEEIRSTNSNPTLLAKISMIVQIPDEFENVAAFKMTITDKDSQKFEILPHCITDIQQEAKRICFEDYIKKCLEDKVDLVEKIIKIEEKKNNLKIVL